VRVSRGPLISGISSATALLLLIGGYFALTGHKTARQHGQQTAATAGDLRSPFTGEPVPSLRPELIFKIDNVPQARPPTGLAQADIVYVLPVEGGLSRIFALFSSHVPPVVGPVRSAREEDIQLLRQFGTPAFAFSGAQPRLLPVVEHARIVNLYAGVAGGFFRSSNRVAPYNLYATTHTLLAEAKGASKARDIGFRFGPAPTGGQPANVYNVAYQSAAFSFRWSAAQHRWLIWMDGKPATTADGNGLGARTIVVQYVKVGTSGFLERGSLPPFAITVGNGNAVVLRDGRAYNVGWSRPTADGGTTFTLPGGQRMPFAQGQVWVVFGFGSGSTR
jgi:Protein of unknown function (DUF3048) N-terminal domain/Protein of unknown function (DUF3048) C-terminal domain